MIAKNTPIGTKVVTNGKYLMHVADPRTVILTESEPWQLGHGQWVVSVSGASGGVPIDGLDYACKPAKDGE